MIDQYYDYCYGELEYRSLFFETQVMDVENYQGNAVVNYTEYEIPYTRVIEHKHFEFQCQDGTNNPKTVITREYPKTWQRGDEPYYPMNDSKNNAIYIKYMEKSKAEDKVIFGGRLGMYQYFDMHQVVDAALKCVSANTCNFLAFFFRWCGVLKIKLIVHFLRFPSLWFSFVWSQTRAYK